jgi:peptidoglycan hydrolase-like protein with peptidoglycan-binding domain
MIRLTILGAALSLMAACSQAPQSVNTPQQPAATSTPAPNAASQPPANSLGRGSAGHGAVVSLQRALQERGYYWGSVDGVYGPGTKTAVMSFQHDLGVPMTGTAGHKEWSALGLSSGQGEPTAVSEPPIEPPTQTAPR